MSAGILERARNERKKLDKTIEALKEFDSRSLTPSPSAIRDGSKSALHDHMAANAEKREALERDYITAFRRWMEIYTVVDDLIDGADMPEQEKILLRYRFLLDKTWKEIAEAMGTCQRNLFKHYQHAAEAFGDRADEFEMIL